MAVHPPAMGGKTAWGVSEVVSRPTDDPEDILKMRKLQAEFSERENERLNRLKEMDSKASSILESRRARRLEYQPAPTNADDFKKRQDDILRKMLEAKERRRAERAEKRKRDGTPAKGKKRKRDPSEGSSAPSSSSSSSDSAGSSAAGERVPTAAEAAAAAQDPEVRRRAEEAKAKERALRRRAREQAAAWAAEAKRREAEAEARRQQEARRRQEEAEAKRKAEAKQRAEEAEAKKRAEEAEAKKKADESEARRKLFQIGKRRVGDGDSARKETVPGGFYKGQRIVATQDITVRGALVVKAGAAGTVVGPSESDPTGRIAVRFLQREDTGLGNLNVVPREIKKG